MAMKLKMTEEILASSYTLHVKEQESEGNDAFSVVEISFMEFPYNKLHYSN
jgi:hypothetical protein